MTPSGDGENGRKITPGWKKYCESAVQSLHLPETNRKPMRKLLSLVGFLALTTAASAQENKPQVRVGGTFYLTTYYDTYKSVENRDGVMYSYPMAPLPDDNGNDIRQAGQLGMSVYASRLHARVTGFSLLGAPTEFYVETDFLGSNAAGLQMIRLRHAWLNFYWNGNELLFGQTNNVLMPAEVIAGVLTPGSGSPITPLSRPTMIRYGRELFDHWKI
jgi:hypothetical protein